MFRQGDQPFQLLDLFLQAQLGFAHVAAGGEVISVGKIADIYAHKGITKKVKASGNAALFDATLEELGQAPDRSIIFTNFVDFDMLSTTEKTVLRHEWLPIEADLSKWAGQKVRLELISDVGTQDNSSGDWACWAEMRIESLQPVLQRTLEPSGEAYRREPPPMPLSGVTVADLRKAKLDRANLLEAQGYSIKQLCEANTMNAANLSPGDQGRRISSIITQQQDQTTKH